MSQQQWASVIPPLRRTRAPFARKLPGLLFISLSSKYQSCLPTASLSLTSLFRDSLYSFPLLNVDKAKSDLGCSPDKAQVPCIAPHVLQMKTSNLVTGYTQGKAPGVRADLRPELLPLRLTDTYWAPKSQDPPSSLKPVSTSRKLFS